MYVCVCVCTCIHKLQINNKTSCKRPIKSMKFVISLAKGLVHFHLTKKQKQKKESTRENDYSIVYLVYVYI